MDETLLTDYLDKIKLAEEDSIILPAFINCSQDEFVKFCNDWKIKAPKEKCNVFHKHIIYSFYGASKFIKGKTTGNSSDGQLVYCIALVAESCQPLHQIYPFDTGAASGSHNSIRRILLDWGESVEKFQLGVKLERINKLALSCFLSLEDYLTCNIIKDDTGKKILAKIPNPDNVSAIDDMHKIMLDQTVADDRRLCYEVLFLDEVKLTVENIKSLIVPEKTLKKESFRKILKQFYITDDNVMFYPSKIITNFEAENCILSQTVDFTKNNYLNKNGQH